MSRIIQMPREVHIGPDVLSNIGDICKGLHLYDEAIVVSGNRTFGIAGKDVVIKNPTGLHLRPAGILCKEAMQFKSMITFSFRGNTANAKSVLSVLGACVKCGDEIEFICDGEDEEQALNTLVSAVENGLGE